MTGDEHWCAEAHRVFDWFLGKNDLRVALYDATTGGCKDGLHPDRVNENQGAESTLSFLMALLDMQSSPETNAKKTYSELRVPVESEYFNDSVSRFIDCHIEPDSLAHTLRSQPNSEQG